MREPGGPGRAAAETARDKREGAMTAGVSRFGRREFVKMGGEEEGLEGERIALAARADAGINCVVRRFVKAHFRIA